MPLRRDLLAATFALAFSPFVRAQQTTPLQHIPQPETYAPTLAEALSQAAEQAETLETSLPSFTCKETGLSQVLRENQIRKSVPFTGIVRAVRKPDGQIEETHEFLTVKDKPAGKHAEVPYYVHDAFTKVLTYVSEPYQPCYHFNISSKEPRRIDFVNRRPFNVQCENYPGTEGYFTWDDKGQIDYLQRTLPDVADWPVPYAAVEISTVKLGEKEYRLASHMESERPEGKNTMHEEVDFTECKLFKSSIRILPDVNEVPEKTPEKDEPAPLKPR